MTHQLVWIFAALGCVLAAWLVFAAWLSYRHAKERAQHGEDLRSYIVYSGERMRSVRAEQLREPLVGRAKVMQLTIGDLVRDESLVSAAAAGISERRALLRPPGARRDADAPPEGRS